MTYLKEIPALSQAVASAKPHPKHAHLLSAIRRIDGLQNAQLSAVDVEGWLQRRKVLNAAGVVLHHDHEAWLKQEAAQHGVGSTWRQLKGQGLLLSICRVTTVFVSVDQQAMGPAGMGQDNFLQLEIDLEDERLERRLFEDQQTWNTPRDDHDLVNLAEQGPELPAEQCTPIRAHAYTARRVVDVRAFVQEAEQLHIANNQAESTRRIKVTSDSGEIRVGTVAEIFPESAPGPWGGRRLFDDWAFSSAGRSGQRLCHHWALRLTDWTHPSTRRRDMSLIPIWGFAGKLAEIKSSPSLSDYALYGKLEAMDRRLNVPFGWFTYMLHGNRVHSWAGERILRAAEAGLIVLPEHDYQVLKAWDAKPYGF
jgi:hypothetical protein